MKYTVHLYTAVRIRMEDIEANSQEEAFSKAAEECDVKHNLECGYFEDDEAPFLGAIVDEVDDEDYENTRYHQGNGAENYLDKEHDALLTVAPALLAALESILLWDDGNLPGDMIDAAHAAIAEAKGEK